MYPHNSHICDFETNYCDELVHFSYKICISFINFYFFLFLIFSSAFCLFIDKTVILESRNNELTLRINETLPSDVLCKIDCNFNCKSYYIEVKKDSQYVKYIQSGDSIFKSRRPNLSDDGTYVCIAENRKSENNFKLTILRKYKSLILFRKWGICF